MSMYDKLNLIFKFLFLAVFAYGVIMLTCCSKSSCSTAVSCDKAPAQCCKNKPAKS